MRRDELRAALRRAGRSARERGRAALGAVTGPAARERGGRAWAAVRRRPDAVLVAGLVVGVLVMILHWS